MAYLYELPNATTGIDAIITQMTSGSFYWFVPILMLFTWLLVFFGGIIRQRNKDSTSDAPAWATIASLSVLLIATFFSVSAGYIRLDWLVISLVLTIFSGAWLFWDRKAQEV